MCDISRLPLTGLINNEVFTGSKLTDKVVNNAETMLRSRIRTKTMNTSNTLIVAHKLYCLFNIITNFVPDLDSNQENNQGKRKLKKESTDNKRSYLQVPAKRGEGNESMGNF